ncbi:protocatechuate 3,4-dioxygenase [Oxalobacteraceae bacterium]|nr:protocatechuate 3,4-dioxygenase [Oxalobacteraceae bacterium]
MLITTSQTIGPFSHEAWDWAVQASAAATLETSARTITVQGAVYDGDGVAVSDAMIEAWLPNGASAEAAQALPGFRRVPSDEQGRFSLRISLPLTGHGEPACYITVFARGLVKHQFSAVFLDDDSALAQSAILNQVPAARRATLIARRQDDASYHWDIRMQGADETVFFDYV